MDNSNLHYSQHAQKRMNQRGISKATVETIVKHGDRRTYCGNGCRAVRLTWRWAEGLAHDDELRPAIAERVPHLTVILSPEKDIVTVFPRRRGHNRDAVKRTKSFHHRRSRRRPRRLGLTR